MNLDPVEIKAFVPATDLELSRRFYLALGFEVSWTDDRLAYVRHGHVSFLLQAFDAPAFARQFQMHLLVADVNDWHAHVVSTDIARRFGVSVGGPEDRPWGMRDLVLFNPAGVLWRIARNLPQTG
ncbi:VOC family protein [Methyloversatilis sp. XJ19-13]|uniref:VOC family protein n=1 Tax=Methyloversatilis sp. XJ19-13 TaxID=2963430 RepID=UPI00211CFEE5|nr:VOC family protein [Methyloversatilis sp. XJ19-13]MCQ9373968.1 VOC family protein [Methyloversatilis sp. XJ19-13]